MTTMTEPVVFNGTNLLSITGVFITGYDTFRYPNRKVNAFELARTNNSTVTSSFYSGRNINIRGVIKGLDRGGLDNAISELRRITEPQNKQLKLPINDEVRIFQEATVINIAFSDVAGGYISFDIEIVLNDPYNYDSQTTELLNVLNLTSGNKSYPVYFEGSAQQLPIITLTLDSASVTSNRTVTFSNPTTGDSISIQTNWDADDVLVINCMEKTVEINGVAQAFSGNFPYWERGDGFVNYTDDFGSRQVDINITYTKRYY